MIQNNLPWFQHFLRFFNKQIFLSQDNAEQKKQDALRRKEEAKKLLEAEEAKLGGTSKKPSAGAFFFSFTLIHLSHMNYAITVYL